MEIDERSRATMIVIAVLLVILSSFTAKSDRNSNVFESLPQTITTLEGQPVQFECRVHSLESWQELIWRHVSPMNVDSIVTSGGRVLLSGNDSRSLVEEEDGRKSTLHIRPATVDLEGSYVCSISGLNQAQTNRLTVNVAASIASTIPENSTLEVIEGHRFQLRCVAKGKPRPVVTWTKQGEPLTTSDEVTVVSAQRSDAGIFRCTANNGAGDPVHRNFSVFVRYSPIVSLPSTGLVRGSFGANVTLECSFESFPPVDDVSWSKEDSLLENLEDHRESTEELMSEDRVISRLTLVHLDREKVGSYRCSGANDLGTTSEVISVNGLPCDLEIVSSDRSVYSDQYLLRWKGHSLSPLIQTNIRFSLVVAEEEVVTEVAEGNSTDSLPDIERTLTIEADDHDAIPLPVFQQEAVLAELVPSSTYKVSMRVSNAFGFSNWTNYFHFMTAKEGNEAPLSTAKVTNSHSTGGAQTQSSPHQHNNTKLPNSAVGVSCIGNDRWIHQFVSRMMTICLPMILFSQSLYP